MIGHACLPKFVGGEDAASQIRRDQDARAAEEGQRLPASVSRLDAQRPSRGSGRLAAAAEVAGWLGNALRRVTRAGGLGNTCAVVWKRAIRDGQLGDRFPDTGA